MHLYRRKIANTPLAQYLYNLMVERDLTMADITRKTGLAHTTIRNLVNHGKEPSAETCVALAKGLEVPLQEILAVAPKTVRPTDDHLEVYAEKERNRLLQAYERLPRPMRPVALQLLEQMAVVLDART